ncbi:uncharacterized protein BX663DRAFT_482238 [Cokeromyces recurvatus]|uniref:uncharacterized protein n=1 Tax=Cokeromyces recurvatus TaxID=90255 RepID=UPI002221189A|nr:uncharacterized protein BX663DRAFT_482238 [Cokeromyces recurvatus]KAI7907995.1 hypothetical protein BX663DRAFT_482238 [Cokeromyces recurvatus]
MYAHSILTISNQALMINKKKNVEINKNNLTKCKDCHFLKRSKKCESSSSTQDKDVVPIIDKFRTSKTCHSDFERNFTPSLIGCHGVLAFKSCGMLWQRDCNAIFTVYISSENTESSLWFP